MAVTGNTSPGKRLVQRVIPYGLVFLAMGCGISDYEKRIDEQALYLQNFDEENKVLGDPLDLPMKLVKDQKNPKIPVAVVAMPLDFFLRPPKGIADKVKPKEAPFGSKYVSLYRYPFDPKPGVPGAKGNNVLVAMGRVVVEYKDKTPAPGELTAKEFQAQVREALADYYRKEYPRKSLDTASVKLEKQIRKTTDLKKQPLNLIYEAQTFTDKSKDFSFIVNFHQQANILMAVIYQVPANQGADKVLDWSLKSLRLGGPEATNRRLEYKKRRRPLPVPVPFQIQPKNPLPGQGGKS